jgi:hypothetical protein
LKTTDVERLMQAIEAVRLADSESERRHRRAAALAELETCIRGSEPLAADHDDDVSRLRQQLQARGFAVSVDDHVRSAAAAAVLGIQPTTLRNWRSVGNGPDWIVRRRAPWYALKALASWLRDEVTQRHFASRDALDPENPELHDTPHGGSTNPLVHIDPGTPRANGPQERSARVVCPSDRENLPASRKKGGASVAGS